MDERTDPRKVLLHPDLFQFPISSSSALRQVDESRDPASTLNISSVHIQHISALWKWTGKRRNMMNDLNNVHTSPFPLPSLFT
jgi:hypothetical protein